MDEGGFGLLIFVVLVALVSMGMLMLIATRYKRCPSNSIMVIYGKVRGEGPSRCIHGGARSLSP